jgi:integrase
MASIYKTPDGSWRVQIRKFGVRDGRNFTRKVDATAWARMREHDIELGDAGLPGKADGTLSDLLKEYHRVVYPLKRYGRSKSYELHRLDKDLGETPLAALTTQRVTEYALELRKGVSGNCILNRLSYLREVLRAAADLWGANTPVDQVDAAMAALKRQKVTSKLPPRTRRASDVEIDRVIESHSKQRFAVIDLKAIIEVLRVLPLRVGELVKIEWTDLDPEQRTVTLRERKHPNVDIKETNHAIIPLPTINGVDTWALIADRPRFLEKPFPYTRPAVSSCFCYHAKQAGVENLHLHDLRAFAISKLLEAGTPIPMIAHVSGHKNWKILQSTYTRLDAQAVREAIEKAAGVGK